MSGVSESDPVFEFEKGTLIVDEDQWTSELQKTIGEFFNRDFRTRQYRAEARFYGEAILALHQKKIRYQDRALNFSRHRFVIQNKKTPRPYQSRALKSWLENQKRGTIVLPTGSGKSYLAKLVIEKTGRNTLVMVPTIDLMHQWASQLEEAFGIPIGLLGGGENEVKPITVSTYDSALIHLEHRGNGFGLLIADEGHHLPGPSTQWVARMSIAPFRLALTATPERTDGGEDLLQELMGPIIYSEEIQDLKGHYLSEYKTKRVYIPLQPEEMKSYQEARSTFKNFVSQERIDFSNPNGWAEFLSRCFSSDEGRTAYRAYRKQKEIIRTSDSKLQALWELVHRHRLENIIIFTDDNATAYKIGSRFVMPVITHHTRSKERKKFLENFKSKKHPYMVTSKVLNEGVDVPEASVGIIVSGSGSIREHVQRLGRILRKVKGKQAILYELISEGTSEAHQSSRRRRHSAYQGTASV